MSGSPKTEKAALRAARKSRTSSSSGSWQRSKEYITFWAKNFDPRITDPEQDPSNPNSKKPLLSTNKLGLVALSLTALVLLAWPKHAENVQQANFDEKVKAEAERCTLIQKGGTVTAVGEVIDSTAPQGKRWEGTAQFTEIVTSKPYSQNGAIATNVQHEPENVHFDSTTRYSLGDRITKSGSLNCTPEHQEVLRSVGPTFK